MMVREELEKQGIGAIYDTVFCFDCGDYFYSQNNYPPSYCGINGHDLEKGRCCRPDIMLQRWDLSGPVMLARSAVIYVNGKIHQKHRQNMKDWNQIKELENRNIQVYVILNEDIDGKTKTNKKDKTTKAKTATLRATVKRIRECFNDESGAKYEEYKRSKEFKERVRKF